LGIAFGVIASALFVNGAQQIAAAFSNFSGGDRTAQLVMKYAEAVEELLQERKQSSREQLTPDQRHHSALPNQPDG
jgi:hypothetical protein